jgi:predicted HTH domain antitoxin
MEIPRFDQMMLTSGRSAEEVDRELRLLLAGKLFERGRVSLGQAAEVAGIALLAMMDELGRMRAAVSDHEPEEHAFDASRPAG